MKKNLFTIGLLSASVLSPSLLLNTAKAEINLDTRQEPSQSRIERMLTRGQITDASSIAVLESIKEMRRLRDNAIDLIRSIETTELNEETISTLDEKMNSLVTTITQLSDLIGANVQEDSLVRTARPWYRHALSVITANTRVVIAYVYSEEFTTKTEAIDAVTGRSNREARLAEARAQLQEIIDQTTQTAAEAVDGAINQIERNSAPAVEATNEIIGDGQRVEPVAEEAIPTQAPVVIPVSNDPTIDELLSGTTAQELEDYLIDQERMINGKWYVSYPGQNGMLEGYVPRSIEQADPCITIAEDSFNEILFNQETIAAYRSAHALEEQEPQLYAFYARSQNGNNSLELAISYEGRTRHLHDIAGLVKTQTVQNDLGVSFECKVFDKDVFIQSYANHILDINLESIGN